MARGIVLALALAAGGASAQQQPVWTVVAPNCATYVLGIGCASDNTVFAAGALNGIGNVVSSDILARGVGRGAVFEPVPSFGNLQRLA
jgi:hypothetical protein